MSDEIQTGALYFKRGKRLHFTRIVRRVRGDEVLYQDGFGQVCASTVRNFQRWAASAELYKWSDSEPDKTAKID
jgi:16S rRNA U1498 N3-methylase RsmE